MSKYLGRQDLALSQLQPFPDNARQHDDEFLLALVKRFGQTRSIVVRPLKPKRGSTPDQDPYQIIAGHGIVHALGQAGFDSARADIIECDDDEALRLNLSDNRSQERGWDDPELLDVQLSKLDGDYDMTGWTEADHLLLRGEEDMPEPGDAPQDDLLQRWGVIVECGTEDDQVKLLGELADRGLNVRAIVT